MMPLILNCGFGFGSGTAVTAGGGTFVGTAAGTLATTAVGTETVAGTADVAERAALTTGAGGPNGTVETIASVGVALVSEVAAVCVASLGSTSPAVPGFRVLCSVEGFAGTAKGAFCAAGVRA